MKRVGRHTIVREIASSAVLSTFEATDEDGGTVRLCVFDRAVELDERAVARFEEDLSRTAALRHPGIDKPIAWSARAPAHVATTWSPGLSLREACDEASAGRLAPAVAAGVGADIAEALHAAHSAGLVHAGVSADSILLGTDGRARVTDFGVMRCLSELAAEQPQVLRGSIESLSPEQLDGPKEVGPQTDVFGVGLALYRAMTGKPAFDAPSAIGMSIRLSMGKPTPIESHGVEIPQELRRIVMEMLSVAPAARPPMDVVARTLEKLAGSWRASVRRLAMSRATPAPALEGATSEVPASSPPHATPAASVPPDPSSPGEHAVATSAAASPDTSDWPSDEAQLDPTSSSFDLATRVEIALPQDELVTDDFATLFELHSPAGPSHGHDLDDELDAAPPSGGDTSPWLAEDQGAPMPKTVILEAPRERTPAPKSAPRLDAFSPAPLAPRDEHEVPTEARGAAPEWALWAAIALGAFALLVGTAALVVLIGA